EWRNAMTVGRFVDDAAGDHAYVLPPEQAASLTGAAGPGNMARLAPFTAPGGGREDEVASRLRAAGGVPYSRSPKFHGQTAPALAPDGVFLCVDVAGSSNVDESLEHPMAPMLYSVSTFHCMTVSLALDGAGLGTMWGEQKATEMFREAGFTSVETTRVPEDILN